MIENSDIKTFNEIAQGNELAFNAIFDKYYKDLCEFSLLIVRNKESAEEIVADLFANIWIKRGNHHVETNLKGYLLRSTKNRTISYMRKKKMNIVSLDDVADVHAEQDTNPEKVLISQESGASVERILSFIPEKSRLVFKMHRFENLKYREIAEILEISQKTVEKHMGKALRILRGMQQQMDIIIFIFIAANALFL